MPPEILYGVGALILLVALLFASSHWRRRPGQDRLADAVTKQNYREEDARSKREGNG